MLSYPAPILLDQSLEFFIGDAPQGLIHDNTYHSYTVSGLTSGDGADRWVRVEGAHFGLLASLVTVQYVGPETHFCTVLILTDNSLSCQLEAVDTAGGVYTFQVCVADQCSSLGNDQIQVPAQPEVQRVSGCTLQDGDSTLDCPTQGGVMITVLGRYLLDCVVATANISSHCVTTVTGHLFYIMYK